MKKKSTAAPSARRRFVQAQLQWAVSVCLNA
jgi:hypothetical protein